MTMLLLITVLVLGVAMTAMAVGVLMGRRPLRGSCGGPAVLGPDGEPMTCSDCNCRAAEEPKTVS